MRRVDVGRIVGNAHIEIAQTVWFGAGTFPRLTVLVLVGCVSDLGDLLRKIPWNLLS